MKGSHCSYRSHFASVVGIARHLDLGGTEKLWWVGTAGRSWDVVKMKLAGEEFDMFALEY